MIAGMESGNQCFMCGTKVRGFLKCDGKKFCTPGCVAEYRQEILEARMEMDEDVIKDGSEEEEETRG
jgi:hypothetical protein